MTDEEPGNQTVAALGAPHDGFFKRALKTIGQVMKALGRALLAINSVGLVLIPVVIGVLGYIATRQQSKADDARAEFDRMNLVMDRIASDKPSRRLEGLNVLMYFIEKNCELSQVFVPALGQACRDSNPDVKTRAKEIVTAAFAECKEQLDALLQAGRLNKDPCYQDAVAEAIQKLVPTHPTKVDVTGVGAVKTAALVTAAVNEYSNDLPKRVYIQIKDPSQRAAATQIQQELRDNGFVAPGIEKVEKMPQQKTELRYFHEADKDQADTLAKLIQHGAQATFMRGYEAKAPLNQFELWLAPAPATP